MTTRDWAGLDQWRREGSQIWASKRLDESTPWFDGHFPGQAILPGVAILAMICQATRMGFDEALVLRQVARVRFRELVTPGVELVLTLDLKESLDEVEALFSVNAGEQNFARGRLVFARRDRGS
ncbi:MAG: hypothetical protein JRF33_04115 [Deltaproteobacteria bacterium]|nr:hypothetical protein [Deltaproteobacteria bacterium]